MSHISLYCRGPDNTIEIFPDWAFKFNPTRLWHLAGYIATERPIQQKDLQIPQSQMQKVEQEYQSSFIEFDRTRPRSDKKEDRQYDPQKYFDFMDR